MNTSNLKKRVAQFFLGLLALLLTLAIAAVAYLSSDAFLEKLRTTAIDAANDALTAKLGIRAVEGSIWSGIQLKDVSLTSTDGQTLLTVQTISARYDLWSALSRNLQISEFSLEKPVINVTMEGGATPWQSLVKPDDSPPSALPEFNIQLPQIRLQNAQVNYLDKTALPDAKIDEIAKRFDPDSPNMASLIQLENLNVEANADISLTGKIAASLRQLESPLKIQGIPQTALTLNALTLALNPQGNDTQITTSLQSLSLKGLIQISDVQASLGPAEALAGTGKISVPKTISPLVHRLSGYTLLTDLNANFKIGGTTSAPTAHLDLDLTQGGQAQLDARLNNDGWDATLELTKIAPQNIVEPAPVDALLNARFQAKGDSLDFQKASTQLAFSLQPSRIDLYHVNAVTGQLTYANGALTLQKTAVDTPYATGNLEGSFQLGSGEFSVKADLGSGDTLPDALKRVVKRDDAHVEGALEANGQLNLEAPTPPEILQQLDLKAHWNLVNFEAEDVIIPASRGQLQASITPEGDHHKRVELDADASVKNLRSRPVRLANLNVKTKARGRVAWPPDAPADLLNELGIDLDLKVQNLISASATARNVALSAKATPAKNNAVNWALNAQLDGIQSGDATVENLQADLKGHAQLAPDQIGANMLRSLAAKGTASVANVQAPGTRVQEAALTLDVAGTPNNLQGEAQLAATQVDIPNYAFNALEADLKLLPGRNFEIHAHATQPDKIPAEFDANIKGKYRADFSGWDIDDVRIEAGEGDWTIQNGARIDTKRGIYEFDNVTLRHKDQSIRIDGAWRKGKNQDIEVEMSNFSIADAPKQFGITDLPEISGKISGTAHAKGDARNPKFDLDLEFTDLKFQNFGPFQIKIKGTYDRDKLEIELLEIDGYQQRLLTASARVPIHLETTGKYKILWDEPFSVAALANELDLTAFRSVLPALALNQVVGKISAELTLEGKLEEPRLDASLQAAGLGASIPGADDDTEIGPLEIVASTSYRTPQGSANGLSFELKLRDQIGDGVALRGAAAFPVAKLIKDTLTGQPTEKLKASIQKSPFSLALVMREYDIQRLNISAVKRARAEGSITMLLTMDGTPEDPKGKLLGRMSKFGWDRFRDIYVDVDADLSEQTLNLKKMRFEWDADEVLTARAVIPVPMQVILGQKPLEDLPIDAEFKIPSLPIAKLSAVDYTFASIRGKMQALLKLSGSLSNPTLSASARLSDTVFANNKKGHIGIEALAKNNRLTAHALVEHETTSVASLRADAPLSLDLLALAAGADPRLPGDIKLSLEATDVDVAGLYPPRIFDDTIDNVKGKLSSSLTVNGTWENPQLAGILRVKDFNAFFPSLGRKVEDGALHVEAADGGLNIVEFYAAENQGYVDAQGRIDLEKLAPSRIALALNLNEFGTSGFTPMPTYISSSMWAELDLTQPEKDIRLGMNDLVVNIPETQQGATHSMTLDNDIVVLDPRRPTPASATLAEVTESKSSAVLAKVQVDIAPGAQFKHPNAQVEFQGKLAIDISNQTAIYGDIQSTSGKIEFLGKQFRVDQGIVTFSGNSPPNPRIQVEASYLYDRSVADELGPASAGDPRAVVRVYGTALRPQLRMSSDPQLTESQIIYVLVSDRAPAAAQAGEEEGVASQAIAAASGLLSGMLKERAKSVYPIDMLRLQTTEGTISGVQVGKYFGKDLFFAYEFIFGADEGENSNEFRLEYQFAPRWLIGTRFGDQANGALFLYWNVY